MIRIIELVMRHCLFSALFTLSLLVVISPVQAEDYTYSDWRQVLEQFVDDTGMVNYEGLAQNRAQLDRFVARLAVSGPHSTPALFHNRNDRLAFYINAYNALVIHGVLESWPQKDRVWSGLISGYSFFQQMSVTLDGHTTNLQTIEDDLIRDQFKDPRIHAAINCASISCPRLPREAFVGRSLDSQLQAAMTEFIQNPNNVDVKGEDLYLSQIFDWFKEDFIGYEKSQGRSPAGIISYLNQYRGQQQQLDHQLEIEFVKYDKRLNEQGGK